MDSIDLKFDNEKFDALRADYSQFHPSVTQLSIIYDLSSKLGLLLNIDEVVARQIVIKSIIKRQELTKQFHFENEQNLSQFKLVLSAKINNIIIDNVIDLIMEPTVEVKQKIEVKISEIFVFYIDEYAGRSNN